MARLSEHGLLSEGPGIESIGLVGLAALPRETAWEGLQTMTNLGETPADGAVGLTGLFASDAAWVRTQVLVARAVGTRDFNLEEELCDDEGGSAAVSFLADFEEVEPLAVGEAMSVERRGRLTPYRG